jgi:hypothetical protein
MKPDEPNDEPKTCWDCNYLTTRGWITEMLRFFEMAEDEDRKALGEVLKRRQFSTKLHRRIEDILEGPQEREWW